ncbi:MAG TPA: DUF3560 domain-containing protein [Polyangia bacterium]|nr:DUF3560 domain-containing protein [Polyangia bacterium]
MSMITATYDPADNKIRIRASERLVREVYDRLRAAGFAWAPKQDLFVAPKWTPEREDLAIELAGDLDDEDTSLVDRAEDRAERFETYSEKRGAEAEGARAAVDAIAQRFEGGQPILVGHHSERRARKDKERIENGARKAIKLWQTSKYWTARAAGALRHAKYKERPDVRARRIKTIESDQHREERRRANAEKFSRLWSGLETATWTKGGQPTTFEQRAEHLADLDWALFTSAKGMAAAEKRDHAIAAHATVVESCNRWIEHCTNRLAYERAMLAESGWTPPPKPKTKADRPLLNYPGKVRVRNEYQHRIDEYEAHPMTKAEFAAIHTDYKGTRLSECGTHRVRSAMVGQGMGRTLTVVYLTDSKTHERPSAEEKETAAALEAARLDATMAAKMQSEQARARAREATAPARAAQAERDAPFEALSEAVKAGVQVVSAPQLFPTPPELAARMVEEADIQPGDRVLEPSAGTGNLLRAIAEAEAENNRFGKATEVHAVEINMQLASVLYPHLAASVRCADFLELPVNDLALGEFDRIVMNPPFIQGADINHIRHAWQFLKPGGRLVALCADGSRQRETLKPWAEELGGSYESLGPGLFKEQGTGVNVALIVVNAPAAEGRAAP